MSQKNKKKEAPKPNRKVIDNSVAGQEAKQLIQKAQAALNASKKKGSEKAEKDIAEAFKLLSEACNRDARMSQAFSLRGMCYHQMGDFQRALYDFSVAIRIAKENYEDNRTLAEYYNLAGYQHFELAQLSEALAHYNLAVSNDPNHGTYLFNRGLCHSRLDKSGEAIKDFTASLATNSDNKEQIYNCCFNRGICFRREGELELSIKDFKKAIETKGEKASAYNNLGLSYFESGDFEDALTQYRKAIQQDPDSAVHFNNRGLAYYHFDQLESAEGDFNVAHQKDPLDPTILFNRGNVYLNWTGDEGQRFDDAHRDYQAALKLSPNNAKLLHSQGLCFQGQAEHFYSRTGGQNSELIDCAIERYQKALEVQENFVSSRFHLGLMYHRINKFQDALKCFTKVLETIRDDKTIYIARGIVYADMGNHQLAISDFNDAIKHDPELSEGYYRSGLSKYCSKRFKEAIKDFKTAQDKEGLQLSKDPNSQPNPGIDNGLAQCYHALQNFEMAKYHYDNAIEADLKSTNFLMNRSQCYFDQGMFDLSIEDLTKAVEFQPSNPQILYKLGLSQYASENYKVCVQTFKLALKNEPYISYEPDIYYHIGLAYCNQQKFEKSIYPYTKCIELVPSEVKYIHERAKAYQMIEDHENAVIDYDLVIKKNPKNAHAHFRRAFSQKHLKNYPQAAEDFEQAKILAPLDPKMVVNYKQLKGITCIVLCKPGEEPVF